MAAQRYPNLVATGIEIDPGAAGEATHNANNSPWANRIRITCQDFLTYLPAEPFGHFVCNPPYFSQGPGAPHFARNLARHAISLPFDALLAHTQILGSPGHGVSLVLPLEYYNKHLGTMFLHGYGIVRLCRIRATPNKPFTRALVELCQGYTLHTEQAELTISGQGGEYTNEFKALCREFYLTAHMG
jgi:tRNA1Val (adenine37-N6)-methyltransferase